MRDISGGADTEQLTFSDASIAKTATKLGIPES
jgi:hypothetical protein